MRETSTGTEKGQKLTPRERATKICTILNLPAGDESYIYDHIEAAVADAENEANVLRRLVMDSIASYERKGYEQTIFALKDGVRGWQAVAKENEEKAKGKEELQQTLDAVGWVLEELSPHATGTLPERVRNAITKDRVE